ncbi:glycosyltransferase family 4 protein [Natronosalvus caseinilyticus]|uniref:glycosyltransferase family 4 protein n=1 Tax=Natronosalvus caseinilyticus TaxID=2953747 RepID=UPI0028A81FD9|nr:glycosyltransferase family 4 protein [Natronosalvus caseinilyticus]
MTTILSHLVGKNTQSVSLNFEQDILHNITELIENIPGRIESIGILVSRLDESEGAGHVAIRQLRTLRDAGYTPTAFTFEAEIEPDGFRVEEIGNGTLLNDIAVRPRYLFNPLSMLRMARRLSSFDLLVVHQPVLCPVAVLTKYQYGTTTIYYNHHITEPNEKVGLIEKLFGYTVYRGILYSSTKLDSVVSVSKYSRDEYKAKFGKTGPVIYNLIDEEFYHEEVSGSPIRDKFGLDNKPVILYVGRLARSKRVHELIDVYERILNTYPDAVLLLVGRKDESDYTEYLVKQKKESDGQIIFTGMVPESELPHYYAATDVYATCSEKEGFNLTIAEAEACGTPTVAYDIGAHSEVQTNGRLVDLGSKDKFASEIIELLRLS